MHRRENHQPSSLPCGHVTVWYVTYFMRRDKKVLKPPSTAVFAYGKYLTTAVIHYGRRYYNMVKNAKLKINRKDYGVLGAPGKIPRGRGPVVE